jgi:hypothetical protein
MLELVLPSFEKLVQFFLHSRGVALITNRFNKRLSTKLINNNENLTLCRSSAISVMGSGVGGCPMDLMNSFL